MSQAAATPKDLKDFLIPQHAVAISLDTPMPHPTSSIYVGTAGDITVVTLGGETVTLKNVPIGDLVGAFTQVNAAGTTASNLFSRY